MKKSEILREILGGRMVYLLARGVRPICVLDSQGGGSRELEGGELESALMSGPGGSEYESEAADTPVFSL